jgi:hypothetical protein
MTKNQLIEALAVVPDNAELYILCDEFGTYWPVHHIVKEKAKLTKEGTLTTRIRKRRPWKIWVLSP